MISSPMSLWHRASIAGMSGCSSDLFLIPWSVSRIKKPSRRETLSRRMRLAPSSSLVLNLMNSHEFIVNKIIGMCAVGPMRSCIERVIV